MHNTLIIHSNAGSTITITSSNYTTKIESKYGTQVSFTITVNQTHIKHNTIITIVKQILPSQQVIILQYGILKCFTIIIHDHSSLSMVNSLSNITLSTINILQAMLLHLSNTWKNRIQVYVTFYQTRVYSIIQ